eukprot:TRINITY_DN65824_c0_g1_i1.p1 TRINITY_DN65824_c0_g1~~TRINITY_DN65824_c0_g1_i1.p1  ORF type:complete len:413 (+),score=132.14 TRINITY_DN65824_c0_g1_i1:102-1241(+)
MGALRALLAAVALPGAAVGFFADDSRLPEGSGSPKFPEIFSIGTAKASSTSLYGKLKQVPGICAGHTKYPRNENGTSRYLTLKEVDFFLDNQFRGVEWYLDHFRWPPQGVSQDSCRYIDGSLLIRDVRTANDLRAVIPRPLHSSLRFLLVLREQVARDLSHFNHFVVAQELMFFNVHKKGSDPFLRRYPHLHKLHGKFKDKDAREKLSEADMIEAYAGWTDQRVRENCTNWSTPEDVINNDVGFGRADSVHGWGCHMLVMGMYELQLPAWAPFRKQLLVHQFHHLHEDETNTLKRIADFLNIKPSAEWLGSGWPTINEKKSPHKARIQNLPKPTCTRFWQMWESRNKKLYKWFANNKGPSMEPDFLPFDPPPCVDKAQL